jgi:uncharacterized protein involved in response to NO
MNHPLFLCGFRPFFLATAGYAVIALATWLGFLSGLLPAPDIAGGLAAWHAHEMIYGFAIASVAGFLLTAIPEFTGAPGYGRDKLAGLALLWLGGRIAFWLSGWLGLWPAALLNTGLIVWLLALIAPPVWRDPTRRQLSFLYAVSALAMLEAGFFLAGMRGLNALPWLYASNGVLMILIVITISRISMRIVNGGIDGEDAPGVEYLARPPRRNLATFAIALHAAAEFFMPGNAVTGWLSLAACAAVLNLLNDWHIGRALFRRWVLMLYAVYWMMALGYGLMAFSLLGGTLPVSAGRHLLMAGAMSLAILTVMCIAGRNHSGHRSERRIWVPVAAVALAAAALLRALSGSPLAGSASATLLALSGAVWIGSFALYLAYSWRILSGPRPDDAAGCASPVEAD